MKKLFSIVSVFLVICVSIAQAQNTRTVTINLDGTRYKQIAVDNQTYSVTNTNISGEESYAITNLSNGQHTLALYRNSNYNNSTPTSTTFNLREGYDMTITVATNGSVSMSETRTTGWRNGDGGWRNNDGTTAISTSAYNKLYANVKAKSSSSSRTSFLQTEFATTNRRYTSSQASKLISLVNSENSRLTLAKQVYPNITDKTNFSLVSNLLNSKSRRTELNNYVASLPFDNTTTSESNAAYIAMTSDQFNTIYNEVVAEPTNDRDYYLQNFFIKDFNYYTSSQVKQLLQLVPNEAERLALAKSGYRGVTDRENYYNYISTILYSNTNRVELKTFIANNGTSTYPNNGYPTTTTGVAMSDAEFNNLYRNVNSAWSSTTRYSQIATAFQTTSNYFTTSQVRQLLLLVTAESDRLTLAKSAFDNITDRYNYGLLSDVFTSYENRTEWSRYVTDMQNGGTGTTYRVAMTDAEYNNIARNLQFTFGLGAKMSALTDIFNKETNYFTSTQVKELIRNVSLESNRLELGKLAYNNVVDPTSYASTLYDLFTSQANRDALNAYISVNPYR